MSPLELDSVKLGVPSVHVGVEPSFEAGGVHARAPRDPYWLPLDVSTAKLGSNRISDMLQIPEEKNTTTFSFKRNSGSTYTSDYKCMMNIEEMKKKTVEIKLNKKIST